MEIQLRSGISRLVPPSRTTERVCFHDRYAACSVRSTRCRRGILLGRSTMRHSSFAPRGRAAPEHSARHWSRLTATALPNTATAATTLTAVEDDPETLQVDESLMAVTSVDGFKYDDAGRLRRRSRAAIQRGVVLVHGHRLEHLARLEPTAGRWYE